MAVGEISGTDASHPQAMGDVKGEQRNGEDPGTSRHHRIDIGLPVSAAQATAGEAAAQTAQAAADEA
jgi:hypothetical protein